MSSERWVCCDGDGGRRSQFVTDKDVEGQAWFGGERHGDCRGGRLCNVGSVTQALQRRLCSVGSVTEALQCLIGLVPLLGAEKGGAVSVGRSGR